MDRNLSWKVVLIVVLVALAGWTLYPPDKTLKPGIDLGGGTSLIYEIDAHGMTADERRGLAGRMISVLRRRIDPANIQNLVWRPQGNTRFEIQMPLASKEARNKRQAYEALLNDLLTNNVTTVAILRSVEKPADQRSKDFAVFAHDSNQRTQVLDEFAKIYDERKAIQQQRDEVAAKMAPFEDKIKQTGLNLDDIKAIVPTWSKLDKDKQKQTIQEYLVSQSTPGSSQQANLDLLTQYT
jgi:SecD/SecF fusion protein